MTTPPDPFWDELGVAWAAINPELAVIMPRLQSRLRRQSIMITASLIAGMPLTLATFLLGVYTIWRGWTTGAWNFVTRGMAIVAIAAILSRRDASYSSLSSTRGPVWSGMITRDAASMPPLWA